MRKAIDKGQKIFGLLYVLGLLGMLSIIVVICMSRQGQAQPEAEKTYQNISASWTLDLEGRQPVDVRKLGEYMDEEKGVLSIYYQLPELQSDVSLIYRSKDVYTRVLSDGEMIYETSVYDSKLYNRSPGNLWNILTIPSAYSSKCLELQIFMVYDTSAVTVDSLLLGDKADIILGLLGDNLFGIVVSALLILIGVVLIVVELLPSYGYARKNHSLFWVGVFALLTGVWSLIETNVLQFCVEDMRILQLIDNMLMVVDSMPLLMYLDSEYQIFKHRGMRILGYLNAGYILLCVALQYSTFRDLHHMLKGAILTMMVTDFVLFIWVVRMVFKLKKEKKLMMNCILQIVGVFCLWFLGIFESLRSMHADRMDRAGLVRVGMLLLCLFFAFSSQMEAHRIMEQGLKYDLISKLAYSDGLTGLGNRTAYLEQLEAYEQNEKIFIRLGIVYLDVNNLKKVNDQQGHEFGDELIRIAASIIADSFGHYGKAYRIGGDEFCVLMTGIDVEENYEKGKAVFRQLIDEANQAEWYTFKVQVAHGFAVCDDFTREKIDEAITIADSRMYEDKQELKREA